jgi:hypothetical protein
VIGMRSGMGTKRGADTADPGATGALTTGMEGVKQRRRPPTNIKGLKKGPRKRPKKNPSKLK